MWNGFQGVLYNRANSRQCQATVYHRSLKLIKIRDCKAMRVSKRHTLKPHSLRGGGAACMQDACFTLCRVYLRDNVSPPCRRVSGCG
jgi:hypothetical protein